ncbi:MAG: RagB/SusD family nutrient uptake outer membrane protein [Bacteroidales bacterium]|nr:RagB/SusD family nutrient uptake outer membrane protein [Bacteroidales bacterium]
MKKIFTYIAFALALVATGCDMDSILDSTNFNKKDTGNFPQTAADADQILTGVYNRLPRMYQESYAWQSSIFIANAASDDCFGAGSTSSTWAQAYDRFLIQRQESITDAWKTYYEGVFRSNYGLQTIPELDDALFDSSKTKNYIIGQLYFLRAWYDWELAQNFGTFPLLDSTEPVNKEKASVDEIYASIASDLKQAISLMPSEYGYTQTAGMVGRATKYAAEALMARIWMFYTGFYKKSDMAGVTKADVINYLKDVRDNSGFGLVSDQREIWCYTNDYTTGYAYGTQDELGTYAGKEGLHWVGNHCKETIWGAHFSLVANLNGNGNCLGLRQGLRDLSNNVSKSMFPYGGAYNENSVNPKFARDWAEDPDYGLADKRFFGTILATGNAAQVYSDGTAGTWWPAGEKAEMDYYEGAPTKEVEKTFLYNKKYINVSALEGGKMDGTIYRTFFRCYPNFDTNSNSSGMRNDVIYIRYADVLLMLDELEGTVTGMNQIRARAGLQPYDSYTFERLQKERRYEFCFEGIRFNDLRRWYPETAGDIIEQNQLGEYNTYRGTVVQGGYRNWDGPGISARYKASHGFMRIPSTEISLANGVLEQTPGFLDEDVNDWLYSNGKLPH